MACWLSAVVLFALAGLPTVLGLASCCVNSTSGMDFVDDCKCLVDDVPQSAQFLAAGETRIYHWVLGTNNSELVSGTIRGNLTFEMVPCNGSASIDIKSGSPASWQNLPSFNSSDDYNLASVTIPAKFTEQACLVTAGENDTLFDIAVYTTLYDRPLPGNGGMLTAEMLSAGTARVLINTTENESAGEVMYSLYWSSLPEEDTGTCTAASENATLRENPNCLFWSACGLESAADGHTEWETLEPNIGYVFEVDVDDDSSYLFNVAMVDARNITSVYAGTNVTFTSTDYQDCVADPDCTSQLNDDKTIIAIAALTVGALALLITAMKFLHTSIAKVMRETVSSRSGSSYLGGNRAFFGKKGGKGNKTGKIHVENFDGIGDDTTPMVSPIKPYEAGSSPYKAKRQEKEEDAAEADGFLAEQRDKPASRGPPSPKRGSVDSRRSRSPRRQTVRLDKDKDASEEDTGENDRARSPAASPRTRNRRGRGGKGEERNGDEADAAARPAPRSERDNSISGGEAEGRQWGTSISGRPSATGGTRTHKSPGSREASPKASRRDYDNGGDDDGEDGEGDQGKSPRDRKAGRRGDWENQVARSKAVKSQSRSRGRDRRRGNRDDEEDDDQG